MQTKKKLLLSTISLVLFVVACSTDPDADIDDTAQLSDFCEVEGIAIDYDDSSHLGFSAQEAMQKLGSDGHVQLTWDEDGESELHWAISYDEDAIYFVEEVGKKNSDDGPLSLGCDEEYILLAAELTLSTPDGELDENFQIGLQLHGVDQTILVHRQPLQELNGTLADEVEEVQMMEVASGPPVEFNLQQADLIIDAMWDDDGFRGVLFFHKIYESDDAISVTSRNIGEFL